MTNEELLAAVKIEIGWLRNELIRLRDSYDELRRDVGELRRRVS